MWLEAIPLATSAGAALRCEKAGADDNTCCACIGRFAAQGCSYMDRAGLEGKGQPHPGDYIN